MEKTSDKIIKYITKRGQASGQELADYLGITDRAVRKQLRALLDYGKVAKIGKPPKVFYVISQRNHVIETENGHFQLHGKKTHPLKLSANKHNVIENNFLYINSRGERWDGIKGFIKWCEDRSMDTEKKAIEYVNIYNKYKKFEKNNQISGKDKIKNTFKETTCLKDVFYSDFYAWEIFGKTKIGQLLLYGKQSQDKKIILEITEKIKPHISTLIKKYKIEAVGFVPPTVKRQVQFMKVLEKGLKISLPIIKIEKAKTEIITPQKTLSKLSERIDNAQHSMFVTDTRKFSNVLIIDDAVGSGATMNQIACKIKKAGVAKNVYGFAITGSAKGFDVISEV